MTDIHYDNAPIVEAIIDVQVHYAVAPNQTVFAELAQKLSGRFPIATPQPAFGIHVGFQRFVGPPPAPTLVQGGFRLSTPKNDRVVLIQSRGFTFSHLPPYSEWATFRDEAMETWETFRFVTRPENVTRISIRYINRIGIPHSTFELADYFKFRPEIPSEGIPQTINAFFMQCQMPQPDLGPDVGAIINLGSGGTGGNPNGQYLLLDFDLVATRQIAPELEVVKGLLDRMRSRKNELFEACITDKVRELIK